MNYRMIFKTLGQILVLEAILMLLPVAVSLYYLDGSTQSLFYGFIITIISGLLLSSIKVKNKLIFAKEGYMTVILAWVFISLFGALPAYIGSYIPIYIDSVFEIVSGFTTTGSTILTDIESLPRGILFWRSFSHWIGGMGVLVFILSIIPLAGNRSVHLMKAEVPGPVMGKLAPKTKSTAFILYIIYIILTVLCGASLKLSGMPWYDSVIHAFGTAGTGGFSMWNTSIAHYNSPTIDAIITIFMILFGINFNMYYFLLVKKFKSVIKNEELLVYFGIIILAILAITINIKPMYGGILDAFRYSSFQVGSIITTTGYCTADFNLWPQFSKTLLFLLMFTGACAGSTGGGIKVIRIMVVFKTIRKRVAEVIRPRQISKVRLDSKIVDEPFVNQINVYIAIYMFVMLISMLIVSIDGFSFETTLSAVVATMGNIGPGYDMVGAVGNFAEFSIVSKIVLIIDMLAGRLELIPVLVLLTPSSYIKK